MKITSCHADSGSAENRVRLWNEADSRSAVRALYVSRYIFAVIAALLFALCAATPAFAQQFVFNSGANLVGWTLQGAFADCNDPCSACTPYGHSYAIDWYDQVNYPDGPNTDPLGNSMGALRMSGSGDTLVPSTASNWAMRLASPDLSSNSSWQKIVGFSAKLYRALGPGNIYARLFVELFDNDTLTCRSWYSGDAQLMTNNAWNSLSYNWWNDATFPTNYTIVRVHIVIWGVEGGTYSGALYLDDVIGTPDTTAPTVTISNPTTNSTYYTTSSTLNLGGTVSDNYRVAKVTWTNSRGGSGTATGTTSWSASGITLYSGTNVIIVTARDSAQNTQTDTINVIYDTSAPTVQVTGFLLQLLLD